MPRNSRSYKLDEIMGYECLPEIIYGLRENEGLSYGRISRWLNLEGFGISEGSVTNLFRKRLGGDPLSRKGYSMGGRKAKGSSKGGYTFTGEYSPASERNSSKSFPKKKRGAFTK